MNLQKFAIVKIFLFFLLGIISGFLTNANASIIAVFLFFSFVIFFYAFLRSKYHLLQNYFFGISAYIFIFLVGWNNFNIHHQKNWKHHYSHQINMQDAYEIRLKIKKALKPTSFHHRYEAFIYSLQGKRVSGNLLLSIEKDTNSGVFKADDLILTKTHFNSIIPPLNPHQFSYKKYLEKQQIYHQLSITHNELILLKSEPVTFQGLASKSREKINQSLIKNHFEKEELAIINALLLGQRQDIPEEVYSNYTKAGAIHILAVSGLHIGIVVLFLNVMLQPLSHLKKGRLMKVLIIVILLWSFVIISGSSASVVRAATMFSFITFAIHRKKQTNIYIVLLSSAFFLLLWNPYFLFEIGFQLSYIAVFSIIWIQPLIYKKWNPKYKITRYFWQLFSVTLAAQLGVFPLSLFYFHQFPGLFFISNLVIIPFLGLILSFGIIIIILSLLNIVPTSIIKIYSFVIRSMNQFIEKIAEQEVFLWEDIYFDWKLLTLSYLLIITFILIFKKFSLRKLTIITVLILLFQASFIYNKYNLQNTNRLIVFHKNRNTLIAQQYRDNLSFFESGINFESTINDPIISSYKTGERIRNIKKNHLKNLIKIKNEKVLIIDSLGIYQIPDLKIDHIILSNSPRINLERLIKLYKPKTIIADGNNYKSFVTQWKNSCYKEKTPFHYTGEKGAYILE